MKTLKLLACSVLMLLLGTTAIGSNNERLNLPGDNLDLYAVMKLFQESKTLEIFEQQLNVQDTKVNNLDLNGDGQVDYIKVIDNVDGNVHNIVLQVAINERENQDVAVFTVQRDAQGNVMVQLVGDEDLYGKDYIIEPNPNGGQVGETPNPGYIGNEPVAASNVSVVYQSPVVEVSAWPLIAYLFLPTYVVWHSPWYWNYYPSYWQPWRPYYWDYYYGFHSYWHSDYYSHYRFGHRYSYAHYSDRYYNGYRAHSNVVYQHRQDGTYYRSYSRPDLRSAGMADSKRSARATNQQPNRVGENRARVQVPNRAVNGAAGLGNSRPRTNGNVLPAPSRSAAGQQQGQARPNSNQRPNVNRQVDRPASRPVTTNPNGRPNAARPSVNHNTNAPSNQGYQNRPDTRRNTYSQPSRNDNRSSNPWQSAQPRNSSPAPRQEMSRPSPAMQAPAQRSSGYSPAPQHSSNSGSGGQASPGGSRSEGQGGHRR